MKIKVLVVAVFSLTVVACSASDEGPAATSTAKDVSDIQVATESETTTTNVEAVQLAEKTITQSVEKTDNATGGEAVYKKACLSCHMTGAAGAPKLGDASAWKPRIAKGSAVLVQSAMTGVPGTAMMAKGACGTCSENDIKAAVDYMIAQSL